MSQLQIIITTGLAMFAMFFGSGNLVFPLHLGAASHGQYAIASIGLIITGVLVPFLGLFSVMLYEGIREKYFGLLGRWAPVTLSFLILSLLGPFGVVPRCIIVAYGGINLLFPSLSLVWFSAGFSLIMMLIIWQKNKIVPIIGKFLGPIKILVILLIIIFAFIKADVLVDDGNTADPFLLGLVEGYQTMDLLAAFFFAITIVEYLRNTLSDKKEVLKISLLSGLLGGFLIASIYICFVLLGAFYSASLQSVKPEQYLATIALLALGKNAALVTAITMFLACLTTAATLSKLFAELIYNDISSGRISWEYSIIITLAISFLFSLTGFATISSILASVLFYIYPALITLSISSLLHKYTKIKIVKLAFWTTIFLSIIFKLSI